MKRLCAGWRGWKLKCIHESWQLARFVILERKRKDPGHIRLLHGPFDKFRAGFRWPAQDIA
jgi:hypothetical protein